MLRALRAWLSAASRGADHATACRSAAEAVSADPWDVVVLAGALARAEMSLAPHDLGLDGRLRVRPAGAGSVLATVPKGAPFPRIERDGRRRRGAFDTPRDLARQVVRLAVDACEGPARRAVDPACGAGAFLVALAEAGIEEIEGVDADPVAIAVASVAAPRARVRLGDGLGEIDVADVIAGNPPFVPPERQDKVLRRSLVVRYPWLEGRFDLAVPFAAVALDCLRPGGGLGLVLPWSLLTQPYARGLRRSWLMDHAVRAIEGPMRFPGAGVDVALVALTARGPPSPLPNGLLPGSLLGLASCPLDPQTGPGDPELSRRIRDLSVDLGTLAEVDTGVVSHGPEGGKARLLFDEPAAGRVPYVDADDLAHGRRRWLRYEPTSMHRAKRPELFESPKLLVQRLRGAGTVRAWLDREGLYAGHTLTVVRPLDATVPLEAFYDLVTSPYVDALLRLENGRRLDLYPKDVRSIPVPRAWLTGAQGSLAEAWALSGADTARLGRPAG